MMTLAAEREMQHIGETRGMSDHDHDMIHELSRRLDSLWRYDQRIANADGKQEVQDFWRQLKEQDQRVCQRLRELIRNEVQQNCF